jgi:hypothetical protein
MFLCRLDGFAPIRDAAPHGGCGIVGGRRYGAVMKAGVVARRLPVLGAVNTGKASTLAMMGAELDRVRASVWARFCGAKTAHLSKRQIRDRLMAEQAPAGVGVPQRLWRATVEDTVDKIRAWQQAVIATEVRPKIYARTRDDEPERKRLLGLAKAGRWRQDAWRRGSAATRSRASGPARGARAGSWPTTAPTTPSVTSRAGCGWR